MTLLRILVLRARLGLTRRWKGRQGRQGAALGFDSAGIRGARSSARYSLGDSPSTSDPGLRAGAFFMACVAAHCSALPDVPR